MKHKVEEATREHVGASTVPATACSRLGMRTCSAIRVRHAMTRSFAFLNACICSRSVAGSTGADVLPASDSCAVLPVEETPAAGACDVVLLSRRSRSARTRGDACRSAYTVGALSCLAGVAG